jgi:predicted ATPase
MDRAIAHYDPERYSTSRYQLGNNSGVIGLNVSALFLWMVGFPERALERANKAVDLARRLNHPYSLAYALFHTGLLHHWRREEEMAQECSRAVLDIAREHEFQVWEAVATCLHGAALARSGQAEQGLAQIRRGIDLYQALNTPPVFWPLLIFMQAEAFWMAGRPEQGLVVFESMQEFVPADSKDLLVIEFYRLRGDLQLAHSTHNQSEAELLYLHALEAAKEQDALMLRLRAAISLARLWRDQGKAGQARQLLDGVYKEFTEGFAIADLKEAQALLEELA